MANITGTSGSDSILPSGVSAGVTGGVPSSAADTVFGTLGNDIIDGGTGAANRLDYSSFTQQINVNFTAYGAGNVVKFGGSTDTFSNFQRVIAGSGNDFLTGNAATGLFAIWMRGNAGNDQIDGASSRSSAADYENSPAAVNINLVTGVALDGWGGTDTLLNVRRVNLSAFNDTVLGGSFGDIFFMGIPGGSKTIDGGGATDRGNEVRYFSANPLTIDLGTTAADGGGFTGSVIKFGGLVDSITRITRVVGGSAADTILGTSGDDQIEGEAGNDLLMGRSGYDFAGYSGFTRNAPTQGVLVNLTTGTATDGWGGTDTLIEIEAVFGGTLADDLTGRDLGFAMRSNLQGLAGNDILRGAGSGFTSADYALSPGGVVVRLDLGSATDGHGFTDTLIGINAARGSAFADTLTGGNFDDWLSGGAGNDVIDGGNGLDRLLGDDGNDIINGGAEVDTVTGGIGQDTLTGGTGGDRFNFTLTATPGAQSSRTTQDLITDFSVAEGDYIRLTSNGAASPDIVYAGQVPGTFASLGSDITLPTYTPPVGLINPLQAWWISHDSLGGWVVVDENRNGLLEASEFAVRLASAITDPTLIRVNGSSIATPGLIGDDNANTIFIGASEAGGARGLGGDDVIYGGGSFDNMAGGLGNDQFVVRNRETTLIELVGEGDDTAWFGVSDCTNGANIEIGRMFGSANLLRGSATNEQLVANAVIASTLFGNGGDDVLWGSDRADTLDGGDGDDIIRSQGGADVMFGGLGNDQFVLDNLGATITEYFNGGIDTAWLAVSGYTLSENIEIGRLAALGAVVLHGSATAENLVANQAEASTLNGNGGNDILWGGAFADTMTGGDGDDIMRGQGGNDVMTGGEGNDQYVVFSSGAVVTEALGGGFDIVYFAGTGSFTLGPNIEEARLVANGTGLVGNSIDELLVGNSSGLASNIAGGGGDDIIYGTAAGDTLSGGGGNDTIYTEGGADRLVYNAPGFSFDQVAGFDQLAGAKIQFFSGSGITGFGQVSLNVANGNTQVNTAAGTILVFGAVLTSNDFLFG